MLPLLDWEIRGEIQNGSPAANLVSKKADCAS